MVLTERKTKDVRRGEILPDGEVASSGRSRPAPDSRQLITRYLATYRY